MSFQTMTAEIRGAVPKLPWDYAQTLVNRAYLDASRRSLWSFHVLESNWTAPALINAGTATVVQTSNTVTFDATGSAALNAVATAPTFLFSSLIQRQFRIGIGTVYNIWGYSYNSGTGIATITLDRPYQESSGSGVAYRIYQCYFAAPVQDFHCWLSIRDIVNYNDLIYTKRRADIDMWDPQRTIQYIPTHVVPYQLDLNPASPTYQFQLFELWSQPAWTLTYQLWCIRKGQPLVNPTDTIPPQLGEDCVLALARKYAYEWAEGNKGDQPQQAAGSDFRFLIGLAGKDYERLYKDYRMQDRNVMDNFRTKFRANPTWPTLLGPFYNSIGGTSGPGPAW